MVRHQAFFSADSDPKSVSEALSEPHKDKWKHAMKDYNAMKNKQVWDLVTLAEGQKSVKSMWVQFKVKKDNSGRCMIIKHDSWPRIVHSL